VTAPEMTGQTAEKRLEEAGEELGRVLAALPPETKTLVREIKQNVQLEFEEQRKQGKYMDRSAFFAAALIGHEDLRDENLIRAAANYVDANHAYMKAQQA
jgi:hypothetical protein